MQRFNQYCKKINFYPATRTEVQVVLVLFFSLLILFSYLPDIDLRLSKIFYYPKGWIFNNYWLILIKHIVSWVAAVVAISLVLLTISTFFISWGALSNKIRFLALALLIGPGLIVNTGFKSYWGRARPNQIMQFGGQANYTTPLQPTDQCKKNCSFVSGHAAVGYSLILVGALTGSRLIWLLTGITSGLIIGFFRIMQGGHFLSDVLFSFFPVWLAMALVIRLFWVHHLLRNYFMSSQVKNYPSPLERIKP